MSAEAHLQLVEDDRDIAEVLSVLLASAGFEVTVARGVAEARSHWSRPGPDFDVLMIDKNLTDGSGISLLRGRTGRARDAEVVVITGYSSIDSAVQALRLGAYDYLEKPFVDLHDVAATVRRAAERRQLRRERDEARARALLAERRATLVHVAAGLAHEVKNPLQGIGFACTNLRDIMAGAGLERALLAELLEQLTLIEEESGRLRELVEGVMDLARPSPRPPRELDAGELVRRSVLRYSSRAEKAGCSLRVRIDEGLALRADDADLGRALDNLVSNAVDASPAGGVVDVSVRAEGPHAVFEVCDQGPGFSPEARSRAFSPFFTTKARGFGLGLCTVAAAADRAGGAVELEDNKPSGARVRLRVPRRTDGGAT